LGNSIDTGTIDIAVDGTNPWTRTASYDLGDMKPSQHFYIDFQVNNVGTNPLNLYKTLGNYGFSDVVTSEPECIAESGTYLNRSCSGHTPVMDIDNWINYDMRVELYNPQDELVWWETIYLDSDNVTLDSLESMEGNVKRTYLGMIPVGWYMKVMQSYHMVDTAGNEYQGDSLSFTMTLTAEQLMGTVVLEDKAVNSPETNSWWIQHNDVQGTLTYPVRDKTFNFTFTGKTPLTNTPYSLVVGADPYFGGDLLGTGVSTGTGDISIAGNPDLGKNLINAKVWLVLSSHWTGGTMSGWSPSSYLFETGLMDYYDADL
jgi:hypothetical protein